MTDDGERRLEAVQPVAAGLIDAVRERDAAWVKQVCGAIETGKVDWRALLVALAGRAAER
ncbi:hypothetical protein JD276_13185 [Leucobacter sp. CSA1]|uniref:Uncharacterized protein n=1 Tax=Leucobacter chromiisoli TaxID=2796471 RepID=A0A934Q825_9MICO|nr:hypothetical protein [Leucobacter chromiisoli]MBK0419985.1 hypothetical protein [Leucobacter chromiisoli]